MSQSSQTYWVDAKGFIHLRCNYELKLFIERELGRQQCHVDILPLKPLSHDYMIYVRSKPASRFHIQTQRYLLTLGYKFIYNG